jgi:hypothetical protein
LRGTLLLSAPVAALGPAALLLLRLLGTFLARPGALLLLRLLLRLRRPATVPLSLRGGALRPRSGLIPSAPALRVLAVIDRALLVLTVIPVVLCLTGGSRHGGDGESGGQCGQRPAGEKLELHCGISWSAAEWGGA